MKNDFKRADFFIKINTDGDKEYFLFIKQCWVNVSKDIFLIYQNSYKKMYRDVLRDRYKIIHYDNVDNLYSMLLKKKNEDPVLRIYTKELISKLYLALDQLHEDEKEFIQLYYFDELSVL